MFRRAALLAILLAACHDEAVPPDVLVRSDPASAAECANGGNVVRTGADLNGDGVLDSDEVTHTTPVCRDPIAVVTRVAEEPPGAQCAAGGTRIESGADRDGDGVL